MDAPPLKPSRIRRLREIDNLVREAKEVYSEFEEHRRQRIRLARKARSLANKVRKQYPDMKLVDEPLERSLHEQVEELAQALYIPNNPQKDDPVNNIGGRFDSLLRFLRRLSDVPWLNPLG
jgi:hypothetical protein